MSVLMAVMLMRYIRYKLMMREEISLFTGGLSKGKVGVINKRIGVLWLLPVLWMGLIFYFSNQPAKESAQLSNKITEVVEAIINEINIEPKGFDLHDTIRSMAHFSLFFVLGILLFIPSFKTIPTVKKACIMSFVAGTAYAVVDETHQLFVNGRSFQIFDIAVDSAGVLMGVLLCTLLILAYFKLKSAKCIAADKKRLLCTRPNN